MQKGIIGREEVPERFRNFLPTDIADRQRIASGSRPGTSRRVRTEMIAWSVPDRSHADALVAEDQLSAIDSDDPGQREADI